MTKDQYQLEVIKYQNYLVSGSQKICPGLKTAKKFVEKPFLDSP